MSISEYGTTINYIQGKENTVADFMSRAEFNPGPPTVQVNCVKACTHGKNLPLCYHAKVMSHTLLPPPTATDTGAYRDINTVAWSLPLKFHNIPTKDLQVAQQREFDDLWRKATDFDDDEYELVDGILVSTNPPTLGAAAYPRVVLPKKWRKQVIDAYHTQSGHSGYRKTLDLIRHAYVWPRMCSDTRELLKKCPPCLSFNSRQDKVPLGRMPEPFYPFQIVSMDLTGPFTPSKKGHVFLFTLIDHLTGWAEVIPIRHKTGHVIADILNTEIFPRFGIPEILISDNGREFVNTEVTHLCQTLGIKFKHTTPYHPQANGKIERFHRTFKSILKRLLTTTNNSWASQLGPAITAYRNTVSDVTGYTPFHSLFGRTNRLPFTTGKTLPEDNHVFGRDRLGILHDTWEHARHGLRQMRIQNETRHQNKHKMAEPLGVGDQVLVHIPGMRPALSTQWSQRWQVVRERDPTYWVRHLTTGQEKVLHRSKLKYVPPEVDWEVHKVVQPPPPADVERAPEDVTQDDTARTTDIPQHIPAPPPPWPVLTPRQPQPLLQPQALHSPTQSTSEAAPWPNVTATPTPDTTPFFVTNLPPSVPPPPNVFNPFPAIPTAAHMPIPVQLQPYLPSSAHAHTEDEPTTPTCASAGRNSTQPQESRQQPQQHKDNPAPTPATTYREAATMPSDSSDDEDEEDDAFVTPPNEMSQSDSLRTPTVNPHKPPLRITFRRKRSRAGRTLQGWSAEPQETPKVNRAQYSNKTGKRRRTLSGETGHEITLTEYRPLNKQQKCALVDLCLLYLSSVKGKYKR